ncbi:MAG: hypothetical protein OXI01_23250 [Albidovulum sp.]|nr:hypothetical protein [Albidovulum sp.]
MKTILTTCAVLILAGCNGEPIVNGEFEGRTCMIEADSNGNITRCACTGPRAKLGFGVQTMSTIEELCGKVIDG